MYTHAIVKLGLPSEAIRNAEGEAWCQGPGLNRRPKAYESSALPLSYPGNGKWCTKKAPPGQVKRPVDGGFGAGDAQ